jgi:hypothetical protein
MNRLILAGLLVATPALALEEPQLWRDPDTGCAYWLHGSGIAPRYRRDGLVDCPETRPPGSTAPILSDPANRSLGRALDALRGAMEQPGDGTRR